MSRLFHYFIWLFCFCVLSACSHKHEVAAEDTLTQKEQQRLDFEQDVFLKDAIYPVLVAAAHQAEDTYTLWGFSVEDRMPDRSEQGLVQVSYMHSRLPAADSGLKKGDRLLSLNGRDLRGVRAEEVQQTLYQMGQKGYTHLNLAIERDRKIYSFHVKGIKAINYPVRLSDDKDLVAEAQGKSILFSRSLLRWVGSDKALLATITAHCIAHNLQQDVAKTIGEVGHRILIENYISLGGESTEEPLGGALGLGFDKELELEADRETFKLVSLAGFNVSQAIVSWKKFLQTFPKDPRNLFAAVHPYSKERERLLTSIGREYYSLPNEGNVLFTFPEDSNKKRDASL